MTCPPEITEHAYKGNLKDFTNEVSKSPSFVGLLDNSGRSPLHWAACGGHLEIVKAVLNEGVSIDLPDGTNWTALMIAVSAGREDVVNYLLDNGADVNLVNSTGQSALHYAASKNRIEVARRLLAAGACVDSIDSYRCTPLHRAVCKINRDMINLLIEHRASVIIKDAQENSLLHICAEEGLLDLFEKFIFLGAHANDKNKEGKLPWELAQENMKIKFKLLS